MHSYDFLDLVLLFVPSKMNLLRIDAFKSLVNASIGQFKSSELREMFEHRLQ